MERKEEEDGRGAVMCVVVVVVVVVKELLLYILGKCLVGKEYEHRKGGDYLFMQRGAWVRLMYVKEFVEIMIMLQYEVF